MRFLLFACLFLGLAATAQQGPLPKFLPQPCDPPVPKAIFGNKSDPAISQRITQLFDDDQGRESSARAGKSWSEVAGDDRRRQEEIGRYLEKGEINSAEDLYHAAMIFQHGVCSEHYKLANELAEKAVAAGSNDAKWLYAATLDRYLMNEGKLQKFGTQFVRVGPDGIVGGKGSWQLYPVDPATTDEERARYNVSPLATQKEKAERMNSSAKH